MAHHLFSTYLSPDRLLVRIVEITVHSANYRFTFILWDNVTKSHAVFQLLPFSRSASFFGSENALTLFAPGQVSDPDQYQAIVTYSKTNTGR